MKKIFSTVIVAIVAVMMSFSAQAEGAQWEVVAGMNVANVDASGASSRIGFHAGARMTLGIPSVSHGFYGNAAALLSLKGFKAVGITLNPFYLDIPVHFGYKYAVNNNLALLGEFGPYFGIGLFGQTDGEDVFGDDGYKRFDFGLGLRAGLEFNQKVPISIGYDFGLLDINDGVSAKNRNLTLSVGYKF